MKPYYVYILIDPLNDEVFYIGKGKGRRAEEHYKIVTNGIENDKNILIKSIQERENHNKVKNRIIGRFDTEDEAFAVESVLIKWMYGLHNLTNEVYGHRHKNIRDYENLEKIQDLDIEIQISQYDGTYTKDHVIGNKTYKIKAKLTDLKNELLNFNPKLKISSPDLSKPKDPSIYIKINEFTRCQLMLKGNGRDTVIFNIRTMHDRKNDIDKFNSEYGEIYNVKSQGKSPYFKLTSWKKYNPHYKNNISEILNRIKIVFTKFII